MTKKVLGDCEYGEQLSRWENEGGALDTCHKNDDEKGPRASGVNRLARNARSEARTPSTITAVCVKRREHRLSIASIRPAHLN